MKGVRKAMATAMVASAFSAPHVTEFLQVDVTATVDAVARLRAMPDFADVKVSPLLLVARALITAARRHPLINSSWDGEEIVVKHYVNLGIAVATERGLVVPNIKDAQDLSLPGLAKALTELTVRAREGRTQPAEMTGGTITITNVGVFGVDAGTPIINPGEAAILAFGQIRDMPWVVDGAIVPRKVCDARALLRPPDHRRRARLGRACARSAPCWRTRCASSPGADPAGYRFASDHQAGVTSDGCDAGRWPAAARPRPPRAGAAASRQ